MFGKLNCVKFLRPGNKSAVILLHGFVFNRAKFYRQTDLNLACAEMNWDLYCPISPAMSYFYGWRDSDSELLLEFSANVAKKYDRTFLMGWSAGATIAHTVFQRSNLSGLVAVSGQYPITGLLREFIRPETKPLPVVLIRGAKEYGSPKIVSGWRDAVSAYASHCDYTTGTIHLEGHDWPKGLTQYMLNHLNKPGCS